MIQHFNGKLIIFLTCAYFSIIDFGIHMEVIVSLLLGVIISCLGLLLYDNIKITLLDIIPELYVRYCFELLLILYITASFFIPLFIYYLPIIFYDIIWQRFKFCPCILFIRLVLYTANAPANRSFILILMVILSGYLAYINSRYIDISKKYIMLKDNTTEKDLLRNENYRILQENQDAAIYMATLKERNRIAREIHDNVGHLLTRSILQVGALKAINHETYLNEQIDQLHNTLNTAMLSIRQSVHDLHDDAIDLESAVNEIIEKTPQLEINFDFDMGKQVPKEIKYCFIAIIKEAITNTIKHGHAKKMQIILREHPGFYQLLAVDNGIADSAATLEHGIGIDNITNRVQSLGGTIKISNENGFSIFVSIMKNNAMLKHNV